MMPAKKNKIDYAKRSKQGFWLGVALFVLGSLGEIGGHVLYGELPPWENVLLVDMIGLGILVAFLSFFVIGIALPLAFE